jgi:hypothetical protein
MSFRFHISTSCKRLTLTTCLILLALGAWQAQGQATQPYKMLLSGHSLTDNPLPDFLAGIAKSKGQPIEWKQQIVIGSPIRWRTLGDEGKDGAWSGYAYGKSQLPPNSANVLRDFAGAASGRPFDALIITEAHHTVASLAWNDTVRYLRHFHERFIEQNPAGSSLFFTPWEAIKDRSDPGLWIRLERHALPVWGCVVTRINISLAHEGRSDRVTLLPASMALVELAERLVAGRLQGVSGLDQIFKDDVHLTPLGVYYLAAFSYAALSGTTPEGAWHPQEITPSLARSLQELAWEVHTASVKIPVHDLSQCRRIMTTSFCDEWNEYVPGKWVSRQDDCERFFAREDTGLSSFQSPNPFVFSPAQDAEYWFAAPALPN